MQPRQRDRHGHVAPPGRAAPLRCSKAQLHKMEDQMACSPCSLDTVLRLPLASNELLSLGLSGLSPQQRAPHAAAQVQPSPQQRTPDMALLDFPISEEEMEWLVALSYEDAPSSVGSGTPAVRTGPAAAETVSTSTTVTTLMPQQEVQQMHPNDVMVPCTAFTGLPASQAEAAAGAGQCDNNAAWIADAAASSAGEMIKLRPLHAIYVPNLSTFLVRWYDDLCILQVWQCRCQGSKGCCRACGCGVAKYSQVTLAVKCLRHPSRACTGTLHQSCSSDACCGSPPQMPPLLQK